MLKKYIGDRKFYATAMAVAVPIMIQNAITNFVGMLDNIMVGQVGTAQMSGVGIAAFQIDNTRDWNSPIVYKTTPEWAEISAIIGHFFQKKAGLYHYLSTAKKNYREYLKGDMVKPKKYFYVLRPILACRWILEKQTPPPMLFSELADACLDEDLVPAVSDLLRLKMETPEMGLGPRIDVINDYLDASIDEVDQLIQTLPGDERITWDELNHIFMDILGGGVK